MRQITISGNLGNEPTLRQTSNGTPVANFDLAVRQDRPNQQTNQYESDWFRVSVFGTRANTVMQYFHKGSHVTVSGGFAVSTYFSQQSGENKTQLEVNATAFDLPDNNRQMNQQQVDINQAANRFNQSQQGYGQQPQRQTQNNGYQPQSNQGYGQQPSKPFNQQAPANGQFADNNQPSISDEDLPF